MFEKKDQTLDNQIVSEDVKSTTFLSKVFGFLSLQIAITALVATGLGILFSSLLADAIKAGDDPYLGQIAITLYVVLGISFLVIFILSIIVNVKGIRGKSIRVPSIIYSIFMGATLSTFVIFVDWYYLVAAFGITALTFFLIYLIGKIVKVNISIVAIIASSFLIGAMLLSGFFLIFYLIAPSLFNWIYVGISAILFVAILLFTAIDVWSIQRIAANGGGTNNLAEYCAFRLYVDFVYIFIRVLYLLLRIFGNRK